MTGQIISLQSHRLEQDQRPVDREASSPIIWWGVAAFLVAFWTCVIAVGLQFL
jgi:hypothetical protein